MGFAEMRDTYADIESIHYRLRAAGALLGVTDNTLRGYADNAGIPIKRASDFSPDAPPVRIFTPDTIFRLAHYRRQQGYVRIPNSGRPKVITVDVIKGGTGKTTTAVELAIHLQLLGMRVLLIDLDIQANATQMMGYEPDLTIDEAQSYDLTQEAIVSKTFRDVLIPFINNLSRGNGIAAHRQGDGSQAKSDASVIKKPFGEAGPHLVPADTFLGEIEQAIANSRGHRELLVRRFIEASCSPNQATGLDISMYDAIIFDCPPSISFTSSSAIAAADYVIAPIRLDAFSVKGLVKLMRELESIGETYRVTPELIVLPTHYAPQLTRIGRMQTQLQQHYRDYLAPCSISSSEEFPKVIDNYLPLTLVKPTSSSSREYRMFAEHVFGKIVSAGGKK